MTNPTTDLAARFEAKREECELKGRVTGMQAHRAYWLGRTSAFTDARDMARTDAAGGAVERDEDEGDAYDAEFAGDRLLRLKRAWSNHVAPDEADHVWLLRMATKGVAAAPPPPAQQGSSSPLSQSETELLDQAAALLGLARGLIKYGSNQRDRRDIATQIADWLTSYRDSKIVPAPLATARDDGTATPTPDPVTAARAVLEGLDPECGAPESYIEFLRNEATDLIQNRQYRLDCNIRAGQIEAALATVKAHQEKAGEDRL